MQAWYRATCFGRPIGPWRNCQKMAREDLVDADLGEYTEWGGFYITVPGDIQVAYGREVATAIRAA